MTNIATSKVVVSLCCCLGLAGHRSMGCVIMFVAVSRGANGSDTDRIVVKSYPYLLLFFGYGYGSDIRRMRIDKDRISDICKYIHKYFYNVY